MITAINLYYEFYVGCYKVTDIVAQNMLTQELYSQCLASKVIPKDLFCECGIFPIFSCKALKKLVSVACCSSIHKNVFLLRKLILSEFGLPPSQGGFGVGLLYLSFTYL